MGDLGDFDINASLKAYLEGPETIITPDADPAVLDCENDPDAFSPGLISGVLSQISEAIGENPDAILYSAHSDTLQFLLKYARSQRRQMLHG